LLVAVALVIYALLVHSLAEGLRHLGEPNLAHTDPLASPERARYVAAADKICVRAAGRRRNLGPEPRSAKPQAYGRWLNTVVAEGRKTLAEWRRIPPPQGDEVEIHRIFRLLEKTMDQDDQAAKFFLAGNPMKGNHIISSTQTTYAAFEQRTADYGFHECSKF
jgi:hypothetical protein